MMKIKDCFLHQILLQQKLKNISLPCKDPDFIRESALGIYTELGEALAVDKSWKTWKKVSNNFDEKDLKEEIADIWIFLINYTLANNISCDEILEEINKKQMKNFERFL